MRMLAVTTLLAAACGSSGSPPTGNAASPSTAASTPSAASSSCPPPSNRCLALVTLRGSASFVVRDLTDINHPKTVGNLGAISAPVFVSASEVSYAIDSNLYRAPLAGSPKTLVTSQGSAGVWNSDGSAVIYTTAVSPDSTTAHQLKAGRDQVLGSVPGGGGGGCESVAGCAIVNSLDFRLLYSPDGTLISLVTTGFSGSSIRVWSSDGKLLKTSDAQGPTMSAWSGSSLYFRDAAGVKAWRQGLVSPFLPGVAWIKPQASAAGGQAVYTARDSSGWGHVYLVDTSTKVVRELESHRSNAVFLTSRYLWYQGERACVAADVCGATPPWHPASGKTYIYDLQTGTETESIITSVSDVWPHAA
ncbi:MAG: hypothetical protein QOI23_491 [Chloroflexota bacterium]|nr:hypothetical protein [Chloroflexota bacterium]